MILDAIFYTAYYSIAATDPSPLLSTMNTSILNSELQLFFKAVNNNNTDNDTALGPSLLLQVDDTLSSIVQTRLFFEAVFVVSSLTALVLPDDDDDDDGSSRVIDAALLKSSLSLFSVAVFGNNYYNGGDTSGLLVATAFLDKGINVQTTEAPFLPLDITDSGQCLLVFSPNNSNINCIQEADACICLPGFYMNSTQSQCTACAAGFYKPEYDGDTTTCMQCEAGWSTQGLRGQRRCWPCPPNSSTSGLQGQPVCSACGRLQIAPDWGTSKCLCVAGIPPISPSCSLLPLPFLFLFSYANSKKNCFYI